MKGKHEVKASVTAVQLFRSIFLFFTWIKTITRMDGPNSCRRCLISCGCTCPGYLHKFDPTDTEPAHHLITLSQAVRSPRSLKTISSAHLCCATFLFSAACRENLKADQSVVDGEMIADSVWGMKGIKKYEGEKDLKGWLLSRRGCTLWNISAILPLAKSNLGRTLWRKTKRERKHYRVKWAGRVTRP